MTTKDTGEKPPAAAPEMPKFPAAPEKAAATTLALWPEAEKAFAAMQSAVEAVSKVQGSLGEFQSRARAAVLDTPDGKYVSDMMAEFAAAVTRGQQFLDAKVAEIAAESMTGLAPKKDTATKAYAEARADFEAAVQFISKDKAAAKVVSSVTMPTLPKSRSASTGTAPAKVSGLAYFRQIKGGEKTYQSAAQNSASSLAFYFCGCLMPDKDAKKGNIGALVQYGNEKGVAVKGSEPWTLELPNGTILGAEKVAEA